jgi:hypothetical protein
MWIVIIMNLSAEEQAMLKRVAQVQTKLGLVVVLGFDYRIPEGWRRLTMEEGNEVMDDLKSILTEWSIVAYQFGSLSGRGYGYNLNPTYGTECGEGFIIKSLMPLPMMQSM